MFLNSDGEKSLKFVLPSASQAKFPQHITEHPARYSMLFVVKDSIMVTEYRLSEGSWQHKIS